jgi:hypothetical protein
VQCSCEGYVVLVGLLQSTVSAEWDDRMIMYDCHERTALPGTVAGM